MDKVKIYNKLVRDKTPDLTPPDNDRFYEQVKYNEYKELLLDKLQTEVGNFLDNPKDVMELVDIAELVFTLAEVNGCYLKEFMQKCKNKRMHKGGYQNRICEIYYLEQPNKKAPSIELFED